MPDFKTGKARPWAGAVVSYRGSIGFIKGIL